MNATVEKNQLIFEYASGILGPSKSIFASTYLFLNSKASSVNKTLEVFLADNMIKNEDAPIKKLKYTDCLSEKSLNSELKSYDSPISKLVGPLSNINWKQVYKGLFEFTPSINDNTQLKLIKMEPGVSVPLHSHDGKEYILVLSGSFRDENGTYNKGDMQINDQKIKHTPMASNSEGCVCLTITEKEVIFFGRYGSFLNLFTFVRSFFK